MFLPFILLEAKLWQVMKIIATSFKRSHACTTALNLPNPRAGHGQPTPLPETPEHSQASLGHLLWGHCSFLLGSGAHKVLFVPSKSLFPKSPPRVLCKFWQLFGGVNGDLLQEGLCHMQVYSTQRPCPRSCPLLTCTS